MIIPFPHWLGDDDDDEDDDDNDDDDDDDDDDHIHNKTVLPGLEQ